MMDFKAGFYKKLFTALNSNAVLMRVDEEGKYEPIWCSEDFLNLIWGGTEEEYIESERKGQMASIHPEDQEEVAYLFQNERTKAGSNYLDIRKRTLDGEWKWVKVRYAFLEEDGIRYAYCLYEDITEVKESQARTEAMYAELNKELNALADNSLSALCSNLTKGVVEDVRGTDCYDVDKVGADINELIKVRLESMPLASDREAYSKTFDLETLKRKYYLGEGAASLVIFSKRQSGRQCFIKYSAAMRKDPATGDVIVLGVETEYNSEKVTEVLNDKVLARQYDMVCYIVGGSYGVVIGEAENIKKGSIFPKSKNGIYENYIMNEVLPFIDESQDRGGMEKALSKEAIRQALSEKEDYTVDVACRIDGEIFYKRFIFYAVDKETDFFILLKSDITDVLREQQEKDATATAYKSMLEQFNTMADESLTVFKTNLTKGVIEEVRGSDLYDTDYVGGSIAESALVRAASFLVKGDYKRYLEAFELDKLMERSNSGLGPVTFVGYCRRQSGRQCFVKFSGSASKNPLTGDVVAFGVETECNTEMINDVLDRKVLAQQYDMVTYIIDGYYDVVIGEAENIKRGSVFPKEKNGLYMDYINGQVLPVVMGTDEEKEAIKTALSLETIAQELDRREPYTIDVACGIGGEVFDKRFMYFAVDREEKYYLLLKLDITDVLREQREQNELLIGALDEAERANVAKTAFLSSMSHEIRTPMNAIIGLDTIALQEPNLPDSTREHLEKIGSSARHLLGLINDILDMSRIESGRMTIRREEFNFREMLDQINTMIGGQCRDKGLKYENRIQGRISDYYIGDDMKLKQVLINILGNAVKFTPEKGTVLFLVEKTSEFEGKAAFRFTVKDTGIGMDKEFLPKIFDAFSQEDIGKANKYGSTGLGMAITKNIVEMMNGNISVESEKGAGTKFTVNVTLKTSEAAGRDDDIQTSRLRVLVIDDDPVDCEHARIALGEAGITPDIVMNGKDAVEHIEVSIARHEFYHLILVDWKMPGQDGIEVTKEIRKIVGSESAVIVLTAYNWDEIEQEARLAGVDHFLAKPLFSANVLPAYRQAKLRKDGETQKAKRQTDLTGKRILVAEDMEINAQIMQMLLGTKQIETDIAENGQIAVDKFKSAKEGHYDAILMDIRMPVLDGLGATEAIRALERPDAKTIPIIAMTANAFDEDVQRSLQAGMTAHLNKPVEQDKLFETLESLIGNKK